MHAFPWLIQNFLVSSSGLDKVSPSFTFRVRKRWVEINSHMVLLRKFHPLCKMLRL